MEHSGWMFHLHHCMSSAHTTTARALHKPPLHELFTHHRCTSYAHITTARAIHTPLQHELSIHHHCTSSALHELYTHHHSTSYTHTTTARAMHTYSLHQKYVHFSLVLYDLEHLEFCNGLEVAKPAPRPSLGRDHLGKFPDPYDDIAGQGCCSSCCADILLGILGSSGMSSRNFSIFFLF